MKNIVLIGLAGSGKTTFGKEIARQRHMDFVDTDHMVEETNRRTIKEIFATDGEEVFRLLETEMIKKSATLQNTVISTGGGAILKEENMNVLKNTGVIIFINRSVPHILEDVDTTDRPLLANGADKLYQLYDQRIHLYKKYCDYELDNKGSFAKVLRQLMEICTMISEKN